MRTYIAIAAVAIGLVPGSARAQAKRSTAPANVPFKVLDQSTSHRGLGTVRAIVSSRDRFERYWQLAWSSVDSTAIPPLPSVDFTKYSVIIVGLGPQPGINASIAIARVQDHDGVLDISVSISRRPRNCISTLLVTEPIQIVQIPATMAIAAFHDLLVASHC
jgi:hypothetical protein